MRSRWLPAFWKPLHAGWCSELISCKSGCMHMPPSACACSCLPAQLVSLLLLLLLRAEKHFAHRTG